MNDDHSTRMAWFKMAVAWLLTGVGSISLQEWVQIAALVYTLLQIYLLVRDRIIRRKIERETARMELDSRPHHHGG